MVESSRLPRFKYIASDFDSLLVAFEEIIRTNYGPYWNDFSKSNLGQALMDLLAFVGDGLHYYQNKRANNLYLDTVERRDILQKIVKLLEYDPTGAVGAQLNALCYDYPDISSNDAIVLSGHWGDDSDPFLVFLGHTDKQTFYVGESIKVEDKTFEVVTPKEGDEYGIIITSTPGAVQNEVTRPEKEGSVESDTFIDILMYEGETIQDRYSAESEESKKKLQQFESSLGDVIENSWQICVNGVRPTDGTPGGSSDTDGWVQATENTFVTHDPGSHVYVVDYIDEGKIRILFGDGETYGAIPPDGQPITLVYRRGGGFKGNILPDTLDPNRNTISAWVNWNDPGREEHTLPLRNNSEYVTGNYSGSYGGAAKFGADEESIDSVRIEAPRHFKSVDKAITDEDIIHISKEFRLEGASVTEQVMKASVQRPEAKMRYFNPLTGDMSESNPGNYVEIKYDGEPVPIYLPSYGANLIEVYIWSLGPQGQPIVPSEDIVGGLSDLLNKGIDNTTGMTSVQYIVKSGEFREVSVDIRKEVETGVYKVLYDPVYDPNELAREVTERVTALFKDKNPRESLRILEVYKVVADIDGILNFEVKLNGVSEDISTDGKQVVTLISLMGGDPGHFQAQV